MRLMTRLGASVNPIAHENITQRIIQTRADLRAFLDADADASDLDGVRRWLSPTYRFQWMLRHAEFLRNSGGRGKRIASIAVSRLVTRQGIKLGFTVPLNTTGPGLCLAHWGTVVIHPEARVGANCRIHVDVVIGMAYGATPIIGDNVYIGPGAKISGEVTVADGSVIGANSVVTKSWPAGLVAGNPAQWLREATRWP
jgi:serine O-acetyltransferase